MKANPTDNRAPAPDGPKQPTRARWRPPGGGARARIGLAFSLLALALFGIFGALSARQARHDSERHTAAALQQLADRLAQRLDADMAERFHEVGHLAALEGVLALELDPARWRALLERLQRSSRHYSWIGLASREGTVLAATQGLLEGRDVRQRPWFVNGLRNPAVGDVHEAKLLAALLPVPEGAEPLRFVDVAAPLQRQGQPFGVIGAHLSWAWAEERRLEALALVAPEQAMEIVLVDRGGGIVLGPPQPVLAGAPEATKSSPRGWSDGQRYLTAASPSRGHHDYPGMDWTVLVRQPEATALAGANALARQMWLLAAAGAGLFGAVGWWLAGRLTEPLRQVARRAQALAPPAGRTGSHDEVAQLAQSLGALIDDLKAREQELRQVNDSLEARVQQRTALLQQVDEDLRSFSRSVSHDVRGPLGSMSQALRSLAARQGSGLSDASRRTIGVVADECDRLRHLTEELLALAMVEQRAMAAQAVDTATLVDEVVAELRNAAPAVRPPPTLVLAGPLPPVTGDAVLLRQVWTNLLSNAFKFSAGVAAPRIEVSALSQGGETVFCVADNGAGFEPGQSGRLFGVFQRLHSELQFPGTGVGLSIVRRAVHRHGGRVWAESSPGQGARFYFSLPRGDEGPKDTAAPPLAEADPR